CLAAAGRQPGGTCGPTAIPRRVRRGATVNWGVNPEDFCGPRIDRRPRWGTIGEKTNSSPAMHTFWRYSLLSSLLLAAAAAVAQGSSREAFYRCKDKDGLIHYGDSMPPACYGLDTEVLDARGMVVRLIEGEASKAERLKREAAEAQARQERARREQHDRMLLDTYLSVADIERLRDQRLEQLQAQYRVTEQNIANMRERQARIAKQVARFRPYSNNVNAPPLPDHLAEEMVNTVNSLRAYYEMLEKNKREQEALRQSFAADIQRFKELKGLQ